MGRFSRIETFDGLKFHFRSHVNNLLNNKLEAM